MANSLTQAQPNGIASVIRKSIWGESQRGGNLQPRRGIANSLAASSQEHSGDVRTRCKKMMWRSVKWRLCLVGSIVILLVVTVVVPVVVLVWRY